MELIYKSTAMELKRSFVFGQFRWEYVTLLLTVIVSEVKANLQTAHACSPRETSPEKCKWFDTVISCPDTERILIREAYFGFRYGNLCDYTANTCMASNECCYPKDGDRTSEYSSDQKYDIYKDCSWKQKCTARTQIGFFGKLKSLYSVLKYECIKEKQVIHFCQESSVTGKYVNIIFDGKQNHVTDNPTECSCVLAPRSGEVQYTVNAPDLRLMTENGNCNSETSFSRMENVNISCKAKFENKTSSRVMLGERRLTLGYRSRPEFLWLRVEVQGSLSHPTAQIDINQVTLKCYKPRQQTLSTTQTSSDTPYSSTSEKASASTTASDFPILAVVIPVVLVVAGQAVLLIFIIRCKMGKQTMNKDKVTKDKVNTVESTQNIKYDTLFSPELAERTNDNYLILEPENVYASIRSDDIYPIQTVTGLVKPDEAYTKLYSENNAEKGYTNLALDNTDNDRIEEDMNSVINDLEQVVMEEGDGTHDYLVLDPQSLYQDSDTAGLSDSEKRYKSMNDTD